MSSLGRTRSRSIRESFSKLRRQISSRSNRKETFLSGIEVDSEDSPDLSTESYSSSYSSSEADYLDDTGLENFLTPSLVLDDLVEEDALATSLDTYDLLDEPFFNSSQPFRFLDLPLEIKQLVYKHYFPPRGATLRIKRSAVESEVVFHDPWSETQAILSTCREIYRTAKDFSQVHSATLDLSHYVIRTGDLLPIPTILSKIGDAGAKCSRLIFSSEQPWNILEPNLFPLLDKVEVWDYGYWRSKLYAANSAHLAADFEGECRKLLRSGAESILADSKFKVPDGVVTEVNIVCDILICVGSDGLRPKQDKLRHILNFSHEKPDGRIVKTDWSSRHSDMGPLPLRYQMAPHMHEYCRYLREHRPELINRAL